MKSFRQSITLIMLIQHVIADITISQTKGVVIDINNKQPIPFVTIYTKHNESVLGTMSNEIGEFSIDFTFDNLYLSHINYEKTELQKGLVNDTIYLTSSSVLQTEITVNNRQPKWIDDVLLRVIKEKEENYQLSEQILSYNYETYTVSDSSGYAFQSRGNIAYPKLRKNDDFKIDAQKNIIKYKDKTAGVDFSNLRRILYDDFINIFNKKFIKDHDFKPNSSFQSDDINVIQLLYKSKKFHDNEGYLVLDTLNNVILEVEQNCGTESNIKNETTVLLRRVASSRGFSYNTWITQNNTKYTKFEESYYISESKYKFYMKTTTKNKKIKSNYFTSIESKLVFNNVITNENTGLIVIPKPYYIVPVISKEMRLEEEALNNVSVNYENF